MSLELLSKIFSPQASSMETIACHRGPTTDGIGKAEALAALASAEHAHPVGAALIRAKHLDDKAALGSLLAAHYPRAVLSAIGQLSDPDSMLHAYKRHHPYGRREAKRARALELQGEVQAAAVVRELIAQRCERDTAGGRCPACGGAGELTKPKVHQCHVCSGRGFIASREALSGEEREQEQELSYQLADATKAFYQYLDRAKAA